MYRRKKQFVELGICLLDLIAVVCSLMIAGLIRHDSFEMLAKRENLVSLFSVVTVLHIAVFYVLKAFEGFYHRNAKAELLFSVKFNLILVVLAIFLGFSMKSEVFTSRLVMGYFFILDTVAMCLVNQIVKASNLWRKKQTNLFVVSTPERID